MLRKNTVSALVGACTLCVIAVVAYGVSLYVIHHKQSTLEGERRAVALARHEDRQRIDLTRSFDQLSAEHEELQKYFIHEEDIVDFLGSIEALGRAYGAVVSTASLNESEGNTLTNQLEIRVKAIGTLAAVQHVLSLLESLPYKSAVTGATIEKGNAIEGSEEWEGTFTVVVVQYKGPSL